MIWEGRTRILFTALIHAIAKWFQETTIIPSKEDIDNDKKLIHHEIWLKKNAKREFMHTGNSFKKCNWGSYSNYENMTSKSK